PGRTSSSTSRDTGREPAPPRAAAAGGRHERRFGRDEPEMVVRARRSFITRQVGDAIEVLHRASRPSPCAITRARSRSPCSSPDASPSLCSPLGNPSLLSATNGVVRWPSRRPIRRRTMNPEIEVRLSRLPSPVADAVRRALEQPDAADAVEEAFRAVGLPEGRPFPLPDALTGPRRALAGIVALSELEVGGAFAVPSLAADQRRWLGLEPAGVLEEPVTYTLDG